METNRFKDKVVLVTGGNSGIGRASALAFAREGAVVVIAARRENSGQEVVDQIKQAGGEADFIKTDMSRPDEITNLFQSLQKRYGRLDCAFNNAGVSSSKSRYFIENTLEDWDLIMNVNLRGLWLCMQHELRQMYAQNSGAIVNNSSITGVATDYGLSIYCASKHGVLGLTRAAALEFAHKKIRVNAVCPGYVETPMLEAPWQNDPGMKNALLSGIPMRRYGTPEDIVGAVLWLCSDEASYMTGKEMVICGGQTLRA